MGMFRGIWYVRHYEDLLRIDNLLTSVFRYDVNLVPVQEVFSTVDVLELAISQVLLVNATQVLSCSHPVCT
jgi:hypothetical protein